MATIGIRREEKHFEARVPLTPIQVKELKDKYGISTFIQPSKLRTYKDQKYLDSKAHVEENIWAKTDFIFAIKEIPVNLIHPQKIYLFFSHTIKGQSYNMPLLKKIIDSKSTLIDYERIITDDNRRLIFFGNYAGFSGMIDSFWAFGRRLISEGVSTPFQNVNQTFKYESLEEAKVSLKKIGKEISKNGTGIESHPLVIGFLGYGNVSKGAQEIVDCFPNEEILPENLDQFFKSGKFSTKKLYKVVFYEKHLVTPKDPTKKFVLLDYYNNPEKYSAQFANYIQYFSIIVNAIFWNKQYPRFITKEKIIGLFHQKTKPLLRVIGDISCDIGGAVEINLKSTAIDDPVYIYDVNTNKAIMGVDGNGPVVLAIDNLPCELPKESSTFFGNQLIKLIPNIVFTDYKQSYAKLNLPKHIKKAIIVYKGKLTPDYEYLQKFIEN